MHIKCKICLDHKARLLKNVTNWNSNFEGTGTMEKSIIKTDVYQLSPEKLSHHLLDSITIMDLFKSGSGIFKEYSDQLWFHSIKWF